MQRGKTGEGYVYYRDRSQGNDSTVYEHQLVALLDHDPRRVFDPDTEVHHVFPVVEYNLPENVEVLDLDDHAREHEHRGRGKASLAATDGGRSVDAADET